MSMATKRSLIAKKKLAATAASKVVATRDPDATRARILDAATQEFARYGLGGARVDRIATQAKANKRMLYYYFVDKDQLFSAVLENTYAKIRAAELELQLLEVEPVEGLRRLVEFTWRYYLDNPEFLTLLGSANLHRGRHLKGSRRVRVVNTPIIEMLGTLLERGVQAGVFRAGIDPLQLYISIAGICAFYLSNNFTLAAVFDRRVADPAQHPARLAHMESLVIGFATQRAGERIAVPTSAQTPIRNGIGNGIGNGPRKVVRNVVPTATPKGGRLVA